MLMNDAEGEVGLSILMQAFDQLPECLFILSPSCKTLYANNAALSMLGYAEMGLSQIDLGNIKELFSAVDFFNAHNELLKGTHQSIDVAILITIKDGSELVCNFTLSLLKEHQSPYVLVSATGEKKSSVEQKNLEKIVEQKVAEKTAAFSNVLERITDGFIAFDRDWNYIYINGNAAKTINKKPQELIGRNLWKVFPDMVGTNPYHQFQKAMNEQVSLRTIDFVESVQKWLEGALYPSPEGLSVFFQDITEKKMVESALEERETMYRTIVETAHEGIWQIDEESRTSFVNNYLAALLGYTKEEMLGRTFLDFMTSEARSVAFLLLAERKQGISRQHEFTFLRKDGSEVHTLVQSSPIIRNGNYAGAVAMVLDNTERKKAEERLVASERRFRALFEHSQDGIALLTETGTILNVSPSIEKILGWTKPELIGTSRLDYIHPDDVHIIHETVGHILEEPLKSKTVEYRAVTKTGMQKWLECTFTNLLSEPAIAAIVLNFRDITERKGAEDKLRESEAKYRKAQAQGKLGHWELDFLSHQLTWSDEIYSMFNVPPQIPDLNYQKFLDCIHPEDREDVDQKIKKALSENTGYEVSHRVILDDGSIRHVNNVAELVTNEAGRIIKVVGMVQDVTEQKKHEQQLSLSEQNYRLLFEKNPVPSWMIDLPSLNFLEVNQAAIDQYGYSRVEFLSMNVRDIRLENYEAFFKSLNDVAGRQAPQKNVVRHKKRNGEIIIVELITNNIFYNGKLVRLASTIDITQKLSYEKQLREKEQQLSVIFNSSVYGMALFGVDKVGGFRFETVNDALCKAIHIAKEKVVGLLLSEIFKAKDIQHLLPGYHAAVATGEVQNFTAISSQRIGDRTVEYTAIPIKSESGEVIQLLSVSNDITEKKKAEVELIKKNNELQQLSAHLENIREEERTEIAREIHDELGQQLTGLKLEISWLNRNLQELDERSAIKIQSCLHLIDNTIHTVRRIATTLRPSILDHLGLAEALRWHAEEFRNHTGIAITFLSNVDDRKFSSLLSISVFRVFQEALTNIIRHAKAKNVQSSLKVEDGLLRLIVADDGIGFTPALADEHKTSLGLVGMRERVDLLKGSFSLSSSPGCGTTVIIEIPFIN